MFESIKKIFRKETVPLKIFSYTALNKEGRKIESTIQAISELDAMAQIAKQGFNLTSIKEGESSKKFRYEGKDYAGKNITGIINAPDSEEARKSLEEQNVGGLLSNVSIEEATKEPNFDEKTKGSFFTEGAKKTAQIAAATVVGLGIGNVVKESAQDYGDSGVWIKNEAQMARVAPASAPTNEIFTIPTDANMSQMAETAKLNKTSEEITQETASKPAEVETPTSSEPAPEVIKKEISTTPPVTTTEAVTPPETKPAITEVLQPGITPDGAPELTTPPTETKVEPVAPKVEVRQPGITPDGAPNLAPEPGPTPSLKEIMENMRKETQAEYDKKLEKLRQEMAEKENKFEEYKRTNVAPIPKAPKPKVAEKRTERSAVERVETPRARGRDTIVYGEMDGGSIVYKSSTTREEERLKAAREKESAQAMEVKRLELQVDQILDDNIVKIFPEDTLTAWRKIKEKSAYELLRKPVRQVTKIEKPLRDYLEKLTEVTRLQPRSGVRGNAETIEQFMERATEQAIRDRKVKEITP